MSNQFDDGSGMLWHKEICARRPKTRNPKLKPKNYALNPNKRLKLKTKADSTRPQKPKSLSSNPSSKPGNEKSPTALNRKEADHVVRGGGSLGRPTHGLLMILLLLVFATTLSPYASKALTCTCVDLPQPVSPLSNTTWCSFTAVTLPV